MLFPESSESYYPICCTTRHSEKSGKQSQNTGIWGWKHACWIVPFGIAQWIQLDGYWTLRKLWGRKNCEKGGHTTSKKKNLKSCSMVSLLISQLNKRLWYSFLFGAGCVCVWGNIVSFSSEVDSFYLLVTNIKP